MSERHDKKTMSPKITQKALSGLYGSDFAVIVEARFAKRVKRALNGLANVVVINKNGLLVTYPEYRKSNPSKVVTMQGYPVGLKLIVSDNRNNKYIKYISDYCNRQSLHKAPEHLDGFGLFSWNLKRKLLDFVTTSYAESNEEKSNLRHTLATLRLDYERSLHKLDKAERITEGLGYNGYTLAYEVPVGVQKIGPQGDLKTVDLYHHLPTDIANLFAIEVYIADIADNTNDRLEITIRRVADNLIASQFEVASSDLAVGWNLFELTYVSDDLVGEAALEIKWLSGDTSDIQLALSDEKAVRFGLNGDNGDGINTIKDTLALRLWQGNTMLATKDIAVPLNSAKVVREGQEGAEGEAGLKLGFANPETSTVKNTMQAYKFPELASRIDFLHGDEKHKQMFYELDFWPLMLSEDLGYMQTHPLIDELSGAIMHAGAPEGTRSVRAKVRTAHNAAPDLLYILARIPTALSGDVETIKAVLANTHDTDKTGRASGFNHKTGILWSSLALPADCVGILNLDIPDGTEGAGDLLFATKPISNDVSWGWCRWYSLYVDAEFKRPAKIYAQKQPADNTQVSG
jgi:hypothetical protein